MIPFMLLFCQECRDHWYIVFYKSLSYTQVYKLCSRIILDIDHPLVKILPRIYRTLAFMGHVKDDYYDVFNPLHVQRFIFNLWWEAEDQWDLICWVPL